MGNLLYTLDGSETITVRTSNGSAQVPLKLVAPYADSRNPKPFVGGVRWPGQKTMSLFEQSEGTWASVGAGTRTFETSGAYFGEGFQRIVTNGAGGTSISRIAALPLTYDATGKAVAIALKVSDISRISGIRLDIGSSNLANRFTWNNILGSQEVRPIQDGDYVIYTLPLGSPDVTAGSPDRSSIDAFQIRITDDGTAPVTIDLERLFLFDLTDKASCVTMDDGFLSWYTLAKPILDRYDILSTMFCIERYHNPEHPNFNAMLTTRMSEAQILEMVEQGHELAYHEVGNDLRGLDPEGAPWTAEKIQASIDSYKKWAWNKFGVDVTSAAYPGGEVREIVASPGITVRDVFADNFAVCRTIGRASADTLPTGDRSLVRCYGYVTGNGTEKMTLANAQARLTEVDTFGGIISWSFHDIVASEVLETDPSTWFFVEEFEAILSAIRDQNIRIATMQELYGA